ncbi:MAG: hypothetical protein DRQ48_05475 [Gammaproteobacteria bacterium]|nr:MAG: hypothetical protein DRQ58_07975 [Gammaproteobacteria bacterium]RKZ70812.1 MAG: hypothetical protein DRQ48_05475 [Gammaproteobacteria bacterium]
MNGINDTLANECIRVIKMANDDSSVNVGGLPSEKWIIDLDEKIFYRHLPRTNDFPLSDARLVHDMIGEHDIEIHSTDFVLGPYRKVQP